MRKSDEYTQILSLLKELHSQYPTYNIGRHLALALSDYSDLWGASDKEILFALEKYETELELDDLHIEDEKYVNKIIEEGMHLETLFENEEEED